MESKSHFIDMNTWTEFATENAELKPQPIPDQAAGRMFQFLSVTYQHVLNRNIEENI